jgi:hypothetical protein
MKQDFLKINNMTTQRYQPVTSIFQIQTIWSICDIMLTTTTEE